MPHVDVFALCVLCLRDVLSPRSLCGLGAPVGLTFAPVAC
jgi:hypothetical protein